jgi:glycogen(starch) synthase
MRIWLAPSAFFPHRGGVEEATLQLASEMLSRGHDVLVVVNRHPDELAARDHVEGIDVARVRFSAPRMHPVAALRFAASLATQVREVRALGARPDIVHVQCPSVQLPPVAAFARLARIPLVVTTQGEVVMDADNVFGRSFYLRTSLRIAARQSAALTACSDWARVQAADFATPFRGAEVIPNGADPAQWQVFPLPDEPVLCAWGRHVPQKGFDLLLRAFDRVREALPAARLLLGGDGPETSRLTAMAGAGVELVGPLDRSGVQDLLQRSRAAVVPSRLEPFGIVAVEAMAAGRGVVWSSIGGLRDATGGLGWPVDPNDTSALADAMVSAVSAPLDPRIVRAHAETLSWSALTDRYLAVYDRVIRWRRAA